MKNEQWEKLKAELLKNPKFRKAYFNPDLASQMGEKIFNARVECGWSQEKLGKKIGTKQSGIARVESGLVVPTLPMLEKIAKALKMDLQLPEFVSNSGTAFTTAITLAQYEPGLAGSIKPSVNTVKTTRSEVNIN